MNEHGSEHLLADDSNHDKKEKVTTTIATMGMMLAGGALIEQVAGRKLLLVANGQQTVASNIEHNGARYAPVPLDAAYEKALQLPDGPAEYESPVNLLADVTNAFVSNIGVAIRPACTAAAAVLASSVPESLPHTLVVNFWGSGSSHPALYDLVRGLYRRPTRLVDTSTGQLARLPYGLTGTIILSQPSDLTLRRLLAIVHTPSLIIGDTTLELNATIVALTTRPLNLPALHIKVSEAVGLRRLSEQQLDTLKVLRRQLLQYRLDSLLRVASSDFDAPKFGPALRPVARSLGAALECDPVAQRSIVKALEAVDEDAKAASSVSSEAVILESMLALLHQGYGILRIGEITKLANTILLGRQEAAQLGKQEVGAIMRASLGLLTKRDAKGVHLKVTATLAAAIHKQAFALGAMSTLKPRPECKLCADVSRDAVASAHDHA